MKRIATLFLAVVMIVSMMAPISVFAANAEYTDPSQVVEVIKYTNADNPTVPEGETWLYVKATAANGDWVKPGANGWTSADGIISLPSDATYRMTIGNTNSALKTPFAAKSDHLYTQTKGEASGIVFNTVAAGIKGTFTLKFWSMRYTTSGEKIGCKIKTSSMSEPQDFVFDESAKSGAYWAELSTNSFTFTGTGEEYVHIYNPTDAPNSLRISALAFKESDNIPPSAETITVPTFTTSGDWASAEGVYSTTANNSPATFTAKKLVETYYDVYYNLALTGNEATAPVAEFNIKNASGDVIKTHRFNTGDGTVSNGKLYLGTYTLSGAASVSVAKIAGTAELKASSVSFEPNFVASADINPVRESAKYYKSRPTILDGRCKLDTSDNKETGTISPNYLNFLGDPAYRTTEAGVYSGYCTRDYLMSGNAVLPSGYYDVWTYAIVDADTQAADDVKAYVYHDGLASDAIDLNYGDMADGTKKWINLGTYYFKGGYANEYVSVGSDTACVRLGGVKFVPNTTYVDPTVVEEIIVNADEADKVEANPSFNNWSTSGAVRLPNGNASYYDGRGATVTFSAKDLTEGKWDVYYYHAPYYRAPNSTSAPDSDCSQFIVKHNGKTDAQNYNGREGANEEQTNAKAWDWKYMGTYDFQGGSDDEYVTLFNRVTNPMRATAVKFVKRTAKDEFVVPAYKISGSDYTIANGSLGGSDAASVIHEGILPGVVHSKNGDQTLTFNLPQLGSATGSGKYKVYALGVKHSAWAGNKLYATVVDGNSDTYEKELDIVNGEWLYIDTYEFAGNTKGEYVQFNFPGTAAGETNIATGVGAVKFEYVEATDIDFKPVPTGEFDVNVIYGLGDESVTLRPYLEENGEQGTNPDGTLRYYTEQIPVLVSVTNGTADDYNKNVIVYGAVYDASNNLKAAKKLSAGSGAILSGKTSEFYGIFDRQWAPGDKLVTFIWDEDLKPISAVYPLTFNLAD